jgi:hypothetical protein
MTARRYATSPTKSPTLETGPDTEARPACAGMPLPFDLVIDKEGGKAYQSALAECRRICARCPISEACLEVNRDHPGVIAGLTLAERTRVNGGRRCTLDGCHEKHLAHGLCRRHYAAQRRGEQAKAS